MTIQGAHVSSDSLRQGHVPVMLGPVLDALAIRPEGAYVDATLGRGGHAAAILDRLGPQGRLVLLDRDPEAVAAALERFGGDRRVMALHSPFSRLSSVLSELGIDAVNGILADLGVSSPQLDNPVRGFSFRQDGPLDMRMDSSGGETAAAWLARAEQGEIARVLRDFGEERFANRIARAIVHARQHTPITRTGELASLVAKALPSREVGKDPATRTFQAIRIHINRELDELNVFLEQAQAMLAPQGRLAVISFHSLEDRIVKRFMRFGGELRQPHPDLPIAVTALPAPPLRVIGKPQRPGIAEIAANPRARSAVLRVAERHARIKGEGA